MAHEMSFGDDMPPPLEDLSEMLKQVDKMKEVRQKKQQATDTKMPSLKPAPRQSAEPAPKTSLLNGQSQDKPQTTKPSDDKPSGRITPLPTSATKSRGSSGFAGMKKGFLCGGGPTNPAIKPVKQVEEAIPFVKPKTSIEDERQLPEVQNAMKAAQAFQENEEWITDDLLEKIIKKGRMAKRLNDPSFMAAITEIQTNPSAAMQKYANNPEMTKFLKDFCGLMAEHFNGMAEQQQSATGRNQSQPSAKIRTSVSEGADMSVRSSTDPNQATAADEQRMQEILANPEIRNILMDPKIQKVFEMLRNDPNNAHRMLRESDPGLQASLKKLVDAGLLQFQR